MAGPSVAVRILADLTQWASSITGAADQAASGGTRIKGAFSNALAAINKTGVLGPFEGAIAGVSDAMDSLAGKTASAGEKLIGAGGAIAGLGVGLMQFGSSQKTAQQQLSVAIENTGGSYEQYAGKIRDAIKEEEKHGDTATETMGALQKLTQATHDPQKALQLLAEASDLAAAKHEDLGSAADQLGKVYNGNTKLLKQFGIQVTNTSTLEKDATKATAKAETADKNLAEAKRKLADLEEIDASKKKLTVAESIRLRDAQDKVKTATTDAAKAHQIAAAANQDLAQATKGSKDGVSQLAEVIKGQANAASDSFAGKLRDVKAVVLDNVATFANKFGPAITAAGAVMTGLGATMEIVKGIQEAGTFATIAETAAKTANSVATGIMTAAQWALNAALDANPIGVVVLAIAALVAAVVLAWKNLDSFRTLVDDLWKVVKASFDAIKNVVMGVFNWIKDNWGALLLGILTGPFGLVLGEIIKHWSTVETFLRSIPGRIVGFFDDAASWLTGAAQRVWDGFVAGLGKAWSTVSGWFAGVYTRIHNALGDAWNFLYSFGSRMIEGLWSGIENTFKSIPSKIGGLFSGLVNSAKGALGIHSPSSVFAEIGTNIMAGLAGGITSSAGQASSAMTSAVGSLTGGIGESTAGTASLAGGSLINMQNVTIASSVDVDLIAQKLSAALTAGRV